MSVTARPRIGRFSLLTYLWGKDDYRVLLLLMVITSVGFSSAAPLIALYLVNDLGASLPVAGLYFTCQALAGFLLSILAGRRSDRWQTRVPFLRGVAIWVAIGWLLLTLAPNPWLAIVAGTLFLSSGGVLTGQAFAMLHDAMTRDGEAQPQLVNTFVRTAWSFGWVFGPLVGSVLATQAGIRAALIIPACLYLLCLVPLRGVSIPVPAGTREQSAGGRERGRNMPLLAFAVVCALAIGAQSLKNTYLAIDVTEHLKSSMGSYGTIVAMSPAMELIALPVCGLLAQKIPIGRMVVAGMIVSGAEHLTLASSTMLWQLYVTQAMDAWVVAVVMGIGLSYAQQLNPTAPGAVSGVFFSAFSVAYVLGPLIGSGGVPLLGIPHLFFISAALSFTALAIMLRIERVAHLARQRSRIT